MSDLNLPNTSGAEAQPDRILTMEEYLEFVQFYFDNVLDKEFYLYWKARIAVNVPFKLFK